MSAEQWTAAGFLDANDRHPELYGDCILLRDDDGIGFALLDGLKPLLGTHVRITIEEMPNPIGDSRSWLADAERNVEVCG